MSFSSLFIQNNILEEFYNFHVFEALHNKKSLTNFNSALQLQIFFFFCLPELNEATWKADYFGWSD